MAHPHRKEASDGHNAKLRRMTEDYGAASGPENNKLAPTNQFKGEGPEEAVGFGADSTKPRVRGDRASRQQIANPVATLKRGGVAKRKHGGALHQRHDHMAGDGSPLGSVSKRAAGGRKGKKPGSTHVNVIVAGGAGAGGPGARPPVTPVPPMLPAAAPAPMPKPPMGAGPMPPGGPGMGGPPLPPPGTLPPPGIPPRKKGGRVHDDEAQDKELIHKVLRDEGLERSGRCEHKGRATGGRLPNQKHHMTAGAATGPGRLEKIGEKPHNAGRPQVV